MQTYQSQVHHYSCHLTTEWEFEQPFINCLYHDIIHEYYIFWICNPIYYRFLNIHVHVYEVLARPQRKEGGNVKSIITSKELRQGREVG